MAGEKTEKATPKRKQDERKKGNIFQSKELLSVISLLVMFNLINLLVPIVSGNLYNYIETNFSSIVSADIILPSDVFKIGVDALIVIAIVVGPMLFASGLVAILVTFAQTKMLFSFENIKFKFNKLNPISGLKRMISLRGLVELVKSIIKIAALIVIIYFVVKPRIMSIYRLFDMEATQAMLVLGDIIISIINTVGAIFIFIAVADYVYQWWEYEKNLRMSKQEIKEEYKQMEGDPQIKGKIKERQRAMAQSRMMQAVPTADVVIRNPTHFAVAIKKQMEGDPQIKGKIKERQRAMAQSRMMQAVPTADVVIRNPTHFAVAIKYDKETSNAPRVIAKGMDDIAMKIVQIAERAGVEIIENPPLARGIYAAVDIDREIPEEFYRAVADVLVFVYSKRDKKSVVSDNFNIR